MKMGRDPETTLECQKLITIREAIENWRKTNWILLKTHLHYSVEQGDNYTQCSHKTRIASKTNHPRLIQRGRKNAKLIELFEMCFPPKDEQHFCHELFSTNFWPFSERLKCIRIFSITMLKILLYHIKACQKLQFSKRVGKSLWSAIISLHLKYWKLISVYNIIQFHGNIMNFYS